ncbi:expressed protein [Echinococcus multilocularis]|uniref:Expressed protein n=1 Tax=Echinococcus multilocularis TaxID=6211 RepID=A0A068YG54_ECHMU|nr:expressed protein [Echinococcus multilocularis]
MTSMTTIRKKWCLLRVGGIVRKTR